jgi:SPP1 family predicted phage head-tail adaptor
MIGYNKSEIIGKLRERVTLQNLLINRSNSGFIAESWENVNTYWTSVNYRSGFEEEEADRVVSEQTIIFTFRYNNNINEKSRLIYRNSLYQVEKVTYSDDRSFMYVTAFYRSGYILDNLVNCVAGLNAQAILGAEVKLTRNLIGNLSVNASVTANLFTASITIVLVESNLSATAAINAAVTKAINIGSILNANSSLAASALVSKLAASSLTGAGTLAADLTVIPVITDLLLDLYPNAAAAYSLRKLRTAYSGSAIRVRRSSDNTEQDIGFTALNVLDESALTTFCGAGNGFVTTWYDQSGNANNATQTTAANQPQIVSNGSVIIQNSKPSIRFDASQITLQLQNISPTTYFAVNKINTVNPVNYLLWNTVNIQGFFLHGTNTVINNKIGLFDSTNARLSSLNGTTNRVLYFWHYSTLYNVATDNNTSVQITGSTTKLSINQISRFLTETDVGLNSNLQEIIIYTNDNLSNRTGISTNINTHYAIY